ncbi:hypothetical protein UK23_43295 [Lentzea aerocolonigenes]|uniref:Uncharacterized protein n=1 Tax=Lentzea aerocolonigenes TaxID=68170 RepID=A0A0F0GFE7_LENAE|nr:hypothetical protein [Lentzea aerocolonigenes]KJK34716.1 hypothetical protein UK23_43295 [Lentzea aerocolonigenes]
MNALRKARVAALTMTAIAAAAVPLALPAAANASPTAPTVFVRVCNDAKNATTKTITVSGTVDGGQSVTLRPMTIGRVCIRTAQKFRFGQVEWSTGLRTFTVDSHKDGETVVVRVDN